MTPPQNARALNTIKFWKIRKLFMCSLANAEFQWEQKVWNRCYPIKQWEYAYTVSSSALLLAIRHLFTKVRTFHSIYFTIYQGDSGLIRDFFCLW